MIGPMEMIRYAGTSALERALDATLRVEVGLAVAHQESPAHRRAKELQVVSNNPFAIRPRHQDGSCYADTAVPKRHNAASEDQQG